ncbi:hypothetical protein [Sulfuricurvum sp.]|uniref:trypsin inhibitor-like cysteine-rich domain-containing protein n=1 Tax=Sulfuricurvum sp. TaxID=2025608 RepID=UPI003562E2D2
MKKIIFLFLLLFSLNLFAISYPATSGFYGNSHYTIQSSWRYVTFQSSQVSIYPYVYNGIYYSATILGADPVYADTFDGYLATFVPDSTCPTGQIYNTSGTCTTCSSPNTIDPNTQLCTAPACPSGTFLAPDKTCVPNTCPLGTSRDSLTQYCVPITCPTGQTLLSDGACHNPCPVNSSRIADLTCHWDCPHWDKSTCGKYFDSQGNSCAVGVPNLFSGITKGNSCMTSAQADANINSFLPVKLSSTARTLLNAAPKLPDFTPQPLEPYSPTLPPVPKPANDPAYTPPFVTPTVEPIPVEPVPNLPANDPAYTPPSPTVAPVTPDSPTVVPLPDPLPSPTPSPVPVPAPVPEPVVAPDPLPSPFPDPLPVPAPAPSTAPLPAPAPITVTTTVTPDPTTSTNPPTVTTTTTVPFNPAPASDPATDPNTYYGDVIYPDVPTITNFDIGDLDHFRYNAETMVNNVLDQVQNVQNTFENTKNVLDQGFQPINLPEGACGQSMSFNFYGKVVDLCPPLTETTSKYHALFQLIVFLVGVVLSIKIFISGLRD